MPAPLRPSCQSHITCSPPPNPQILLHNAANYSKGLLSEILEFVMGSGLIPADGEVWRVRRRCGSDAGSGWGGVGRWRQLSSSDAAAAVLRASEFRGQAGAACTALPPCQPSPPTVPRPRALRPPRPPRVVLPSLHKKYLAAMLDMFGDCAERGAAQLDKAAKVGGGGGVLLRRTAATAAAWRLVWLRCSAGRARCCGARLASGAWLRLLLPACPGWLMHVVPLLF